MRARVFLAAAALALGTASAAAGQVRERSLVGRWEQDGADPHAAEAGGRRQSFVFNGDGSALWIFTAPAGQDTFALRYHFDTAATPDRLDLSGFASGPLQGRTLYCIVDRISSSRIRMDCEPGRPGTDPEDSRPDLFTAHTVAYRRVPR